MGYSLISKMSPFIESDSLYSGAIYDKFDCIWKTVQWPLSNNNKISQSFTSDKNLIHLRFYLTFSLSVLGNKIKRNTEHSTPSVQF